MKKTVIFLLILLASVNVLAINVLPSFAEHTVEYCKVFPIYYSGGAETKTFRIKNDATSKDAIFKVLIVFPQIQAGDTDYRPTAYNVSIEDNPTASWSATYEAGLRQVTFEASDENADGIPPDRYGNFTIVFAQGPTREDVYTWTVSTTDVKRQGYTVYPWQIIDTTKPFVRIDVPEKNSVVDGVMVDVAHHYMWTYVTAFDHALPKSSSGSNISKVEIKVDSGAWIDITGGKISGKDQYKYQIWNLAEGQHTITARAWDGAGNWNSTEHTFTYRLLIPRVTVGPTTTYNSSTGMVAGSIYKTIGTNYTIEWSSGLSPNTAVSIEIYLPTYNWYASQPDKSHWVLVAKTTSNALGGGKASFIFPTTPKGKYTIRARTGNLNYTQIVEVIPGIVLEPGKIIGSAMINATATGLGASSSTQQYPAISLLCNDTDALQGVNIHTLLMWYTDGNGTLSTGASTPDHFVNTGFLMQTFESGTYEITIGVRNGQCWTGSGWEQHYTEIYGYITVTSALKEAMDAADKAYKAANNAAGNATNAYKKADDAYKAANNAAGNATNAYKKADDAYKAANNAAENVTQVAGNATAAYNAATDAKNAVVGLTMPVYLAVIFSLIAAIVAAVCAVLVYRKIA